MPLTEGTDLSMFNVNRFVYIKVGNMKKNIAPPFDLASAKTKVQRAEDLWNSKHPSNVAQAYSQGSVWRNRDNFIKGRTEIINFLNNKWQKELNYRLRKQLFTFDTHRIAVDFQYEYQDINGQWHRAYGLEHWQFDDDGLMTHRESSINEINILETQRTIF